MGDEISVKKALGEAEAFIIPRRGLQLPQRLAFDRWFDIGEQLATVSTSSAWCLGDWLVYGEAAYEGRYHEAVARTMLDYGTLRNYAWVARRFPLSRRRDKLSFGHHAEVAALPEAEQEYWLCKAVEFSWSRNHLRREVRASLRERERPFASGEEPAAKVLGRDFRVSFSGARLEICRAAASVSGVSLEKWILRTLEEAAKDALRRSSPPGAEAS